MKISNLYQRFIKFGRVADQREREKIVDILKNWKTVESEFSNIDEKYRSTINAFIGDNRINEMLQLQPNIKSELVKNLFEVLENIEKDILEYENTNDLRKVFNDFSKIPEQKFINFAKSSNKSKYKKHLLDNYPKDEINVSQVKADTLKIEQQRKKQEQLIQKQIKVLEEDKATIASQIEAITNEIKELNSPDRKGLKVVKKIDLDTGKELPYIDPSKEKIKALQDKVNQLEEQQLNVEIELEQQQNELKKNDDLIPKLQATFTENWRIQLELKEMQRQLNIIDKLRATFLEALYKEIEELKKLMKMLKPFLMETNDFGRLWDMSKGNWRNINFRLLQKYAQILEKEQKLQELAKLLGRYRMAEATIEQETFDSIETVSKYDIQHAGKSELVGVTESDDLNNLLPTELALFSDIQTENIFFKRFAEKKLQTFKYIDKSLSFENKTVQDQRDKKKESDKGPFILAIDTSGSMHGTPEQLAKIIAFAITKIGMQTKRKVFLITFSTQIKTFDLSEVQHSLPKLIDFLQMSFNGGTDASDAVKAAVHQMKTKDYKKADLLIISDGVFSKLNKNILHSIEALKDKGNRFNALMIGDSYNEHALSFCNNVWQYRYADNLSHLVDIVKLSI